MHSSYASDWGLDLAKELKARQPMPTTLAYTSYILDDVVKDPASQTSDVLAAMVPCMRLYNYIGSSLKVLFGNAGSSNPFEGWVETYSSEDFTETTEKLEELLNTYAALDGRSESELLPTYKK
ncbi:unnamed protein product, partial [Chrysoparadoxa australica]